jgi:hypothetical protein
MVLGRRLWICLVFGMLGLNVHAAEEAMPIKVRRLVRDGDAFNVQLLFEQTRQEMSLPASATTPASAPASRPAGDTLKAELTCRVDILDVDILGNTSAWITIAKFVSLADNKPILPPGAVVGVLNDDREAYLALRDGTPLSPEARAVLFHVHPLQYQLDDKSFGSNTGRKPGDTWNVDAISLSQIDSNAVFQVDPESVKGKVTFVGPEKAGNVSGWRLNAEVFRSGRHRVARIAGDTIDRQDISMQISMLYPLEPALPPLETRIVTDSTTTITRREEGKQAGEFRLEVRTHTVAQQTIVRVAK